MNLLVPDFIKSIKPYVPGKPIEELEREYDIKNSIKLASNENPLGPSPKALKAIQEHVSQLHRYPDGSGYYLTKKLSEKFGIMTDNIVLGNGSDDIIGLLTKTFLVPGDEAIIPLPSFLMYDIMVRSVGAVPVAVPLKDLSIDLDLMKSKISPKTRMIFITNPNNPTGSIVSKKDFKNFIKGIPNNIIIVIDEAYIEFVKKDQDCVQGLEFLDENMPIVTLRTFSKAYGLAGLRIGYGIMPKKIASFLHRIRQPFNTNSLAQIAAIAALDDTLFLEKTIKLVHDELEFVFNRLDINNIKYFPSHANFFLVDVKSNAQTVFENMLKYGVIIRSMVSYGYPEYIRVNIGLHEENIRFIEVLSKVMA